MEDGITVNGSGTRKLTCEARCLDGAERVLFSKAAKKRNFEFKMNFDNEGRVLDVKLEEDPCIFKGKSTNEEVSAVAGKTLHFGYDPTGACYAASHQDRDHLKDLPAVKNQDSTEGCEKPGAKHIQTLKNILRKTKHCLNWDPARIASKVEATARAEGWDEQKSFNSVSCPYTCVGRSRMEKTRIKMFIERDAEKRVTQFRVEDPCTSEQVADPDVLVAVKPLKFKFNDESCWVARSQEPALPGVLKPQTVQSQDLDSASAK
jgi:hypothetical protein